MKKIEWRSELMPLHFGIKSVIVENWKACTGLLVSKHLHRTYLAIVQAVEVVGLLYPLSNLLRYPSCPNKLFVHSKKAETSTSLKLHLSKSTTKTTSKSKSFYYCCYLSIYLITVWKSKSNLFFKLQLNFS